MSLDSLQDDSIFSLIFQNSVEGILVTDSHGKIIRANPSCLKTFGYEMAEVLNQPVENFVPSKLKKEDAQQRKTSAKAPLPSRMASELEIYGLHKSGKKIPLQISLSYIESDIGLLIVCFIVDVSKRKRLEVELRKERQLIQQYLEVTNSIFLVLDKKGQIAMINKAGSELLGVPEDKLRGENWFDKFIPLTESEPVREIFRQMMKNEATISLSSENLVIGKNGALRLVEWHNTLLKDKSGRPEATLSSGVDITEKRALEIERTEALVIGQENERRRLAQELHDGLGQSISAIGLNLNALEPELKHFNDKFKKIYDEVREKLNQTIDEVRTISRNLTPQILEDFGLARALEHLCETIDKSTVVELNLNLHGDLRQLDKKVALGLYRIIQELVNNALKHANSGSIDIHVTRAKTELIGIVEDDGCGFDVNAKSDGLGLSNVQSRALLLKGEIHIDSCKKSGTSVSINIPL